MEAFPVVLMVGGPIIVIGTALYLWRQRAPTPALRRRRGLQIAIALIIPLFTFEVYIERDLHKSQVQRWSSHAFGILLLLYLPLKLRREHRAR